MEFLGVYVSEDGFKMDKGKVEAIQQWPTPRNVKGIREFIEFANFYHRFIPEFSKIVEPLHALTKKDTTWEFGQKEQSAFDEIKWRVSTSPVLVHADPE
jgi:hypothetical protein